MTLPIALIAAVATQVLCQLFKVFFYSAKDGVFSFSYFFTSGGMPSAHSAFVTALAVGIGLSGGVDSNAFAVAAVFGFIVMYDAFRLRGTVEKQTKIIRRLIQERTTPETEADPDQPDSFGGIELPNMLGHTVPEIAIGIVVGLLLGGGITLLLHHVMG